MNSVPQRPGERAAEPRTDVVIEPRRNAKRLAGTAGCIGAAAALAAHAASATFRTSGTVSQGALAAGNVFLTIPTPGQGPPAANRMTLAVSGVYPANPWNERAVDVTNAGNLNLASFTISSQADASNPLSATDGTGVVLIIDECPTSWTENTGVPTNPTYTCAGNANVDVLGCATCNSGLPVDYAVAPNGTSSYTWSTSGSPALANINRAAGAVNHLRFRFKLAGTAPNSAQGKSVNVTFTFDGTQRAGTSK